MRSKAGHQRVQQLAESARRHPGLSHVDSQTRQHPDESPWLVVYVQIIHRKFSMLTSMMLCSGLMELQMVLFGRESHQGAASCEAACDRPMCSGQASTRRTAHERAQRLGKRVEGLAAG